MTIADMIGNVDVFSAAVALGIGGGVTIIAVTGLARRSRPLAGWPRTKATRRPDRHRAQHQEAQELEVAGERVRAASAPRATARNVRTNSQLAES